jgi:hypothetical protein
MEKPKSLPRSVPYTKNDTNIISDINSSPRGFCKELEGYTSLPVRLQSLNEYISAMNRNRFVGAKMKKDAMALVGPYLKSVKPQGEAPYLLKINYFEPNMKRDKDNVSAFARKIILDSLQEVGILPNDGWNDISGFQEMVSLDKNNPRIEISLIGEAQK